MKVWYGIYKATRSLMIEYYVKINGTHYSMTWFRKLNNRKRYKPERILKRRFLAFTPYPYIPLDYLKELPCFQVEDIEVIVI